MPKPQGGVTFRIGDLIRYSFVVCGTPRTGIARVTKNRGEELEILLISPEEEGCPHRYVSAKLEEVKLLARNRGWSDEMGSAIPQVKGGQTLLGRRRGAR